MANDRYGARTEVYVTPYSGAIIKYGFLTNMSTANQTALGHTKVDRAAALPTGLVFGANAPKPGRARTIDAGKYVSSFYSIDKASALKAAKWQLTFPTIRRGRITARSKAVYVTIDGVKYAWNMPIALFNLIGGDFTALGIVGATSADEDLVFGARYPVPPKAQKSDAGKILTTIIDPSKLDTLPADWSPTGKQYKS